MALLLVFHNDAAHDKPIPEISNYDVAVLVGDGTEEGSTVIHTGRIEDHHRIKGWQVLVQDYLTQLREA